MADFGLYRALTVKDDFAQKRQDAQFNLQALQNQSAIQEKIMQDNLLAQEQINKTFSELAALPYLPEDMNRIKEKMVEDKKFVSDAIRQAGGDLRKFMLAGGSTILNNYKNGILTSKEVGDAKYNAVAYEMIQKSKAEGYRPAHPMYSTYEEIEQSRFAEGNPNPGRIDFRGNIKNLDYKTTIDYTLKNPDRKKGAVNEADYAAMMTTFNPMLKLPNGQNTKVMQDLIDIYKAGQPLFWGQGTSTGYDQFGNPIKPAKPGVPLSVPTFSGLKLDANGRIQYPTTQEITPEVSPVDGGVMVPGFIHKVNDEYSKESFQFGVVNMVAADTPAFSEEFLDINGLVAQNELRFSNKNFVTLPTSSAVDRATPHLTLGAPDKLINLSGGTADDFRYQGGEQAPIMRVFTRDNSWKSPVWLGTVQEGENKKIQLGNGYMGYENALIAFADPSRLNRSGISISDFSQADQELIKEGRHFYGYNSNAEADERFFINPKFGIATTEEGNYHFYSGPSYTSTNNSQISSSLMQQQSGANVQIRDSYNSGSAILNPVIDRQIPKNGNLGLRFQQ